MLDVRRVSLLLSAGLLLGSVVGVVAPRLMVPGPPALDKNLASDCELRVHQQTTELLDLKERVQAARVAWNRAEHELAPIGGVPSWWASQALLEAGRERASARAAQVGVPVHLTDCDENPCILILAWPAGTAVEPARGEVLSVGEGRAALALPVERAAGPDGVPPEPPDGAVDPRQLRAAVRSDRLLSQPTFEEPR